MAIDIHGTIAARVKHDAVVCSQENSSFYRVIDAILPMLLESLLDNTPLTRAKALQAYNEQVSIIVEADPEVFGDKRVQSAVERVFSDSAISVREAALHLVGKHIASHPDVGVKYFEKIAARTRDDGLSVQKRAIKIIRDMCSSNANFSGFTRACREIISCAEDQDEDIREMNSDDVQVRALPYAGVLHAFCLADPILCAPASNPSHFVVTLLPYLKNQVDNGKVVQLLESILLIFDAVLPLLQKLSLSIVEELKQELKRMIVEHKFFIVVHACIKCLISVSKKAGKGAAEVEHLIRIFLQNLDNKKQVGRSLLYLGLLIRCGNHLLACSSNKLIDVGRILKLFMKHLCVEDSEVTVKSLTGLGFVLIARPEYMLENDVRKILEESLCSVADTRVKIQALQSMFEFILDVNSQNQKGTYRVGAVDINILSRIVPLHWDNILDRCLDFSEQVRRSALKIVHVVVRRDFADLSTCVPYLIALETDPLESNSQLAHKLLKIMYQCYPALCKSRWGDGLQMSFMFMQSICGIEKEGRPKAGSLAQARLRVSRVYEVVQESRVSRNNFMSLIVQKFDNPTWDESVIAFLTYCTEFLASLPFSSPDEPLYLIYAINQKVQARGEPLERELEAWKSKQHAAGFTYRLCFSKVDLEKVQACCLSAIALQLLLKLKRHIKRMYSLNDARCKAYTPNKKPKHGEVISGRNIAFDISESQFSLPTSPQELKQRCEEFKNALRKYPVDYSRRGVIDLTG